MQHVGRLMHWDDSCPVAPIRALVEAGDAGMNFSLWLWPYGRWGGLEAMGARRVSPSSSGSPA